MKGMITELSKYGSWNMKTIMADTINPNIVIKYTRVANVPQGE